MKFWLVIVAIFCFWADHFSLARGQLTPHLPSYEEVLEECREYTPSCVNGRCEENPLFEVYGNGSRICVCFPGWVGRYCDQEGPPPPSFDEAVTNICRPNPCQRGGTCKKTSSNLYGYYCICKKYLTGRHCESDCQAPYFGEKCDQKCTGCTRKLCRVKKGCAKCNSHGYVGPPYCNITNCLEIPCENFGRCLEQTNDVYGKYGICWCQIGYVGSRCETYSPDDEITQGRGCKFFHKNYCAEGSTCIYKASATGVFKEPHCICAKGYMGKTCEVRCRSPTDCKNGDCSVLNRDEFRQMSTNNDFILEKLYKKFVLVCICWPGFTGKKCKEECPAGRWGKYCKETCGKCKQPPCHHAHGLCPDNMCARGYYGVRCEKQADYSNEQPFLEQNMGLRLSAFDDRDESYDVDKNPSDTKKIVDHLRLFISDSYEKYKKNIVAVNQIFIKEVPRVEVIATVRKLDGILGGKEVKRTRMKNALISPFLNGGGSSRTGVRHGNDDVSIKNKFPGNANVSTRDNMQLKVLEKREPDAAPANKQYDVNFTVAFAGELNNATDQAASILRKEAKNFEYPGVSIVKSSIKTRGEQVVKGTLSEIALGSESSDGASALKNVVALVLVAMVGVALFVLAGWMFVSGASQAKSKKSHKRDQASKSTHKDVGKSKDKGHTRSESASRKLKHTKSKRKSVTTTATAITMTSNASSKPRAKRQRRAEAQPSDKEPVPTVTT